MNTLGYLGLIPFAVGAALVATGATLFALPAHVLFITYSAIILSFLGGVLWGRSLARRESLQRWLLLLLSNVMALLAWFVLLAQAANPSLALLALSLGYLVVWLAEWPLDTTDGPDPLARPYAGMRLVLTGLVVSLHLVVLGFL